MLSLHFLSPNSLMHFSWHWGRWKGVINNALTETTCCSVQFSHRHLNSTHINPHGASMLLPSYPPGAFYPETSLPDDDFPGSIARCNYVTTRTMGDKKFIGRKLSPAILTNLLSNSALLNETCNSDELYYHTLAHLRDQFPCDFHEKQTTTAEDHFPQNFNGLLLD